MNLRVTHAGHYTCNTCLHFKMATFRHMREFIGKQTFKGLVGAWVIGGGGHLRKVAFPGAGGSAPGGPGMSYPTGCRRAGGTGGSEDDPGTSA